MTATHRLTDVLAHLDRDRDAAVDRLVALLAIPSISAQPAHAGDCARAAALIQETLSACGFQATLRQTAGRPIVLAHHPGPGGPGPGRPRPDRPGPGRNGGGRSRALFYGHYDVQPPDPLGPWHSPPFSPAIVDGPHGKRVVARGAVDDKGQVAGFLEAVRAWHAAGGVPVPLTVLIEGEEEVGSTHLPAFLRASRDELAADFVLVSDTDLWDFDTPAITTSLRGLCYMQVDLRGPGRDLHSGLFGGAAINPLRVLTRILGDLHDDQGRVRLPGFYDDVRAVSPECAAAWDGLRFDEAAFLAHADLTTPAGERDAPALQRLWARPTADINGIWGGYQGDGAKTVIPSEAGAKVSFRLVPGQDPGRVRAAFERFVTERLPADVTARFANFGLAPAIEVPADSAPIRLASAVLAEEFGRPPVLMGSGGSIPVVESFKTILGLDTVLMGFGLSDDGAHSPNEKFELPLFHRCARAHARLLARLADA